MKNKIETLCQSLKEKAISTVLDGAFDDEIEKEAEAAAMDEVGGSGPYFEDFSHEDQESLKAAFKDGFFSCIHSEEREQGRKALDVLGRLHDGLSDMIEGGRLREGDIPDDYQWLVSMLVNESLPLFAPGERVKAAGVSVGVSSESPAAPVVSAKDRPIPADPEDKNEERSGWAASALDEFQSLTNCDDEDRLCDLLANLGHYADRNGLDLGAELRRAEFHYVDETGGEGVQFDFLPPVARGKDPDWHEVRRVLLLSTGHLEGQTIIEFEGQQPTGQNFRLYGFDHGWVCKLPNRDELELWNYPADLLAVFDHARGMGLRDYDLIVFDGDASQVPSLAMYDAE